MIFMITAKQCKAARAILEWSHRELAKVAAVGSATVHRFERGQEIKPRQLEKIERTLREEGIDIAADGLSIDWRELRADA